jgi:hypothetical protein
MAVTGLALGLMAVGTWAVVRSRASRDAGANVATGAREDLAASTPRIRTPPPVGTEAPFVAPEEPTPPEPGTPARAPYFRAMVAGDERALQSIRDAVTQSKAGRGSATPAYLKRLQEMEVVYAERLVRHRRDLDRL